MRFAPLAAALAAACLAVPAVAADNTVQIGVRYADLDLSTEAGRATLDQRVEAAAREMCGTQVTTGTILPNSKIGRCVERAKASVHETIAERVARDRRG